MDIYTRLISWCSSFYTSMLSWAEKKLLDVNLLIEISLFMVFLWALKKGQRRIKPFLESVSSEPFSKTFHGIIRLPKDGFLFLLVLPLSTYITSELINGIDSSINIFSLLTPLVFAYSMVRIFQSAIDNSAMGAFVSWMVWGLAAINVLGYTKAVSKFLKSVSFELGSYKMSLLNVFESIIILSLVLWVVGVFVKQLQQRIKTSRKMTSAQKLLFVKLSKSAIYTIAILYALSIAGVDLTTITVFSGAIGFGLGFGLKQILSNLISGVILLMDRSIKPGDVIAFTETAGKETFGKVTQIEPRYVSVETLDGRKHLVPNEYLITNKVENWSFGNNRVAIGVPIGVSYQSDVKQVREIMIDLAKKHERVLTTPEPIVLMNEFAESSINLELRVWIEDPSKGYKRVRSDLMYAIWDAFQENKITIPYPQRDLHIKEGDLKKMG